MGGSGTVASVSVVVVVSTSQEAVIRISEAAVKKRLMDKCIKNVSGLKVISSNKLQTTIFQLVQLVPVNFSQYPELYYKNKKPAPELVRAFQYENLNLLVNAVHPLTHDRRE